MPRAKKTETVENPAPVAPEVIEEPKIEDIPEDKGIIEDGVENPASVTEKTEKEEIPSKVLDLMRLYPQYEKIWVTPKGFVHPENTPKYLLKGAKLYSNKYFNN